MRTVASAPTVTDVDERCAAEAQRLVQAVKGSQDAAKAAELALVADYEKRLDAFVVKQVSKAGAVADLTDEQRGYINGFALGLILGGRLPSSSADRILAPVFGDDFFASRTTTVRLTGQTTVTVSGQSTGTNSISAPETPIEE